MQCGAYIILNTARCVCLYLPQSERVFDTVLVCCGMGARTLSHDTTLIPMMGVLVRVCRPGVTWQPQQTMGGLQEKIETQRFSPLVGVSGANTAVVENIIEEKSRILGLSSSTGQHFHRMSFCDGKVAYIYPRRGFILLGGVQTTCGDLPCFMNEMDCKNVCLLCHLPINIIKCV